MATTDLRADSARDNTAPEKHVWNELVRRFEENERIQSADDDEGEALIDLAGALIGQIMAMPAPDEDAVRWKLDQIVGGPTGSEPYTADYVAQLVADYRRFLAPDSDAPAIETPKAPDLPSSVPSRNPPEAINELACEIQSEARRALYLIMALDDAAEHLEATSEEQREMLDRVHVLAGLAEEAARNAMTDGETVERLSMGLMSAVRSDGRAQGAVQC
ncbi:MAG: hypothetical protein ABIT04_01670 [Novosphingobium sp.]